MPDVAPRGVDEQTGEAPDGNVTEGEGRASAVLLRAVEPVSNVLGRTQGPGRLCMAMGIDRRLNAADLTGDDFHIDDSPVADRE